MPARRLAMRKLKEILRLKYDRCLSHRTIATACKVSSGTVSDVCRRFRGSELKWSSALTDDELNDALYPKTDPNGDRVVPDWKVVHRELRRKDVHVTRALLWDEYDRSEPNGYSYSWFCDTYDAWLKKVEPVMRQTHKFGEKCFVDFAGDTVPIHVGGEILKAQVFVGVLGGSNYTFCDLTWSQSLPDWIEVQNRMLADFEGVPEMIIPDNLKSAVTKPSYYEPSINLTYEEFAKHNDCAIVPARVRKPKDKAKAESSVLQIERQVLAPLRNRVFYSLEEARKAVSQLMESFNSKPFQKLPGSRKSMFLEYEKSSLRPLPKRPFELGEWKERMVDNSYHFEFESSHYSVPFELCRERIEIRITARILEAIYGGQRVAIHERATKPGQTLTKSEHMPLHHRFYRDFDLADAQGKLRQPGACSERFLESILSENLHDEQKKRLCRGLLKSLRSYGAERYEKACKKAFSEGIIRVKSIASILKLGLDKYHDASPDETNPIGPHENVRGSDYFQKAESM